MSYGESKEKGLKEAGMSSQSSKNSESQGSLLEEAVERVEEGATLERDG
jgi:hypothetical protein